MAKPRITPLRESDWEVLRCVRTELELARVIAARLDGVEVEEAIESGRSVEVATALRRLAGHGLVIRDYDPVGLVRCVYSISDEGVAALRVRAFERLTMQAA